MFLLFLGFHFFYKFTQQKKALDSSIQCLYPFIPIGIISLWFSSKSVSCYE